MSTHDTQIQARTATEARHSTKLGYLYLAVILIRNKLCFGLSMVIDMHLQISKDLESEEKYAYLGTADAVTGSNCVFETCDCQFFF